MFTTNDRRTTYDEKKIAIAYLSDSGELKMETLSSMYKK